MIRLLCGIKRQRQTARDIALEWYSELEVQNRARGELLHLLHPLLMGAACLSLNPFM